MVVIMNIRSFIFPAVAGVVMAIAGLDVVEQPIKTISLLLVLCGTHEFVKEKKT
jgi:hypothetical protein